MQYENKQRNLSADRTIQPVGSKGKSLPAVPVLQRVVIGEKEHYFTEKMHYYSSLDPGKTKFETKEKAQELDDELQRRVDATRGIPDEMRGKIRNPLIKFGGSNIFIGPEGSNAFNTPPGSPSNHEHDYREEISDAETLRSSLILNFTPKKSRGDFTTDKTFSLNYKGGEKKQWMQKNESIDQEDRHHARFSTYAFNEAAKLMPGEKLIATGLSKEEKNAKKRFLTQAKKEKETGNETTMHEPDQGFLPSGNTARVNGGSFMGIHMGTDGANSIMGQLLHFNNPQNALAKQGTSNILVREQDNKIYRYHNRSLGVEDQQQTGINNAQTEEKMEVNQHYEEEIQMQEDDGFEEQNNELNMSERMQYVLALMDEGWSESEVKDYFWDMTDVVPKSLKVARQIFIESYFRDNVGPTINDFSAHEKNIRQYVNGKISADEFKELLFPDEDSEEIKSEEDNDSESGEEDQRQKYYKKLIGDGWSVSEVEGYFWEVTDEVPESMIDARETFVYYYTLAAFGSTDNAHNKHEETISQYVNGKISAGDFKKLLFTDEDDFDMEQ